MKTGIFRYTYNNILKTRRLFLPAILLSMLFGFASCNHKDLCFDHYHNAETMVVFDWRNAPDANPSSMAAVMFDRTLSASPIRFIFSGRDGGRADVPAGGYDVLGMNADLNDWAQFRSQPDIETVELLTADATRLEAYNLLPATLPKVRDTEDERMAETPHMAYSGRTDSIYVNLTDPIRTITIYPEEIVCHYSVRILDVENLENARGEIIDGTLSGMAEGYLYGKRKASEDPVTHPFTLAIDNDNASLSGHFLTFGESPVNKKSHILTIYLFLSDGSKWYYTFDVTDQVRNAPDPHHVDIIVRGLTLPRPLKSDAGIHPDVNEWQTETVEIQM